jgi:carboxymethylenebutenolidase
VADMRAGLDELARRARGGKLAAVGFCFGGGMVWLLLASGEPRWRRRCRSTGRSPTARTSPARRPPSWGSTPSSTRASTPAATALERAGLPHELVTFPGAGHAFFNDTGARYDPGAAAEAYRRVLAWFGRHLA